MTRRVERVVAQARVSVVAPVYNEEECLPRFYERVRDALTPVVGELELILVDDGSKDGSFEILEKLAAEDPSVRVLSFSRNFGHQAAVTAGLDASTGDCVVVIDSDLQDPPEVIVDLLAAWADGGDVVHAVRSERHGEKAWRNAVIGIFYRTLQRLTSIRIQEDSGDFRLYDRRAVQVMNALPERQRFIRGLASWVGFEQTQVEYVREARFAGESKYPVSQLIRLALMAITSFSYVPLQIASYLGFILAAITGVAMPVVIVGRLLGVGGLGNQTTVLVAVMFLGGVQLLFLGVLGEYIGRMSEEQKQRPPYVIGWDSGDPDGLLGPVRRGPDGRPPGPTGRRS